MAPQVLTDTSGPLLRAILSACQDAWFKIKGYDPIPWAHFVRIIREFRSQGAPLRSLTSVTEVEAGPGSRLLAALLREQEGLQRFFDSDRTHLWMVGNHCSSVSMALSLKHACSEIIRSAAIHSIRTVTSVLSEFLQTGSFPMTTVHLVKGPGVSHPIDLDAHACLVPYGTALSLMKRGGTPFDQRLPGQSDGDACGLVLQGRLHPGTEKWRPSLARQGVARFGPDLICLVLGLLTKRAFHPFSTFEIIPDIYSDTLPMSAGTGSQSMEQIEFPVLTSETKLELSDKGSLIQLVELLADVPDDLRVRIGSTLDKLRSARSRRAEYDQVTHLHTAFETLLGPIGWKQNKARTIAQRAASLCKDDHVGETMERLSSLRNKMIHGESPLEDLLRRPTDPSLINRAMAVLGTCIKRIIQNPQLADWGRS